MKDSKSTDVSDYIKDNPYDSMIDIDNDETYDVSVVDLFDSHEITETASGSFKMVCPDCGLQGGRTEGFILFPNSNTAYCHSSGKHFKYLEVYALKKKIIRCLDGREKGDNTSKILAGELFTSTLEEFRNEFGTDTYDKMSDQLKIKTSIELPGDNSYTSSFADKLGDVYKSRNVLFFRGESNEVVEIRKHKNITKNGEEYIETGFDAVRGGRFVTLIELLVKPWTVKFFKNGGKLQVERSMTQSTGSVVLESSNLQSKLPPIKRIFEIPIPILYNKKLTFPKKGYDKRFASWLISNSPEIIDKEMTLKEAKENISTIFEEFCFASEKDKIHAIAGFLTPFLHGLLLKFSTRTPVFIYMANRERAGKDYCAGCTGMLYEGSKVEQPAICNDETGSNNEELRKKITACMRQGKKRFHSANNKGLLNNSIFEGVTTAEKWEDRILGRTEVSTFDNEMDYSLSGNLGIRLTPDMSNRARIINLHLVDEDANARKFQNPDLHGWIMKNRELILSSLYALVRNWVENGMKPGTVPFASFPEWANVCGGIMESAGYDNPCKPDKTAIISLDSETEEMKLLFETAYALYPDKWLSKKDIQEIVENENIMDYLEFTEKSHQVKFGIRIDKFLRRILSEIYMEVDSLEQRPSRRKYKFTKQSVNVSSIGNEGSGISISKNNQKNIDNEKTILNNNVDNKNIRNVEFISKNFKDFNEKTKQIGNLGKLGNLLTPTEDALGNYNTVGETLPSLPTLPIPLKVPQEMEVSFLISNFDKMSQKTKQLEKEKADKEKPKEEKEKTDRELQFWESPECENIVVQCTKEEVLEWITKNPNKGLQLLNKALGLGCLKHTCDLIDENLIKRTDIGWELTND